MISSADARHATILTCRFSGEKLYQVLDESLYIRLDYHQIFFVSFVF